MYAQFDLCSHLGIPPSQVIVIGVHARRTDYQSWLKDRAHTRRATSSRAWTFWGGYITPATMFLITLAIPCGLRWRWVEQKWIQWIARCVLRLKRGPWICPCCNSVIMSCTGGLACILHFKIITFCLENYPDDGLVKETSGGYSFILANLWKVERKGLKRPLIHVIQLRLLWFLGRFSLWQRQHWEQHCDGCVQYDEE